MDIMWEQAAQVLDWYDGMENPVPRWYRGIKKPGSLKRLSGFLFAGKVTG